MKNIHDSIYQRAPVNRLAAIVTSCREIDSNLSGWQIRQNLVDKLKKMRAMQPDYAKGGDEYKVLAKEINSVEKQIANMKMGKKFLGVDSYFVDVVKEKMTRFEFDKILNEAKRRMDEDNQ